MRYTYEVSGTAAGGQTWISRGDVETELAGQFLQVPVIAVQQAFAELTQGKAVYGEPGVGCVGPYRITKMVIEAA